MLWSTIGLTGVKDSPIAASSLKRINVSQLTEHTAQPIPFSHDTSK